jgi:hypothetical protein
MFLNPPFDSVPNLMRPVGPSDWLRPYLAFFWNVPSRKVPTSYRQAPGRLAQQSVLFNTLYDLAARSRTSTMEHRVLLQTAEGHLI